ncbi:MAG TPA: hypothetical protein VMW33_04350 [Ilumatobacteraceae bacterium]|nr:hypothetical protein [Ilumatobacteraceae bacterium]
MDVLGPSTRCVVDCPVRPSEANGGDAENLAPVRRGETKIESIVEIELGTQPRLVDIELAAQPRDEYSEQNRVRIRHRYGSRGLAALSGVEAHCEHSQVSLGELPDDLLGLGSALFDLGELLQVKRVRLVTRVTTIAWFGRELDVANPDRHRPLGDAEFVGNLPERPRLRSQFPRPFPLDELASVAHESIMNGGCRRVAAVG